ncbi:pentapeptide repeat-containing protein [uncultured Megasphaera sp.]|uniref:pentapeptide repeat-containing protein n=1 Tax=uncultured Megasphaera sp. TaxID=165188 RepID=UPI00265918F2|nr:pentapeptide repeat-containing protein [uncultured Megasphaera sp.]
MSRLTEEERRRLAMGHTEGMVLNNRMIDDVDLTGAVLRQLDFSWSDFITLTMDGADLRGTVLTDTRFDHCSLRGADLRNADLQAANLRYCDLTGVRLEGANLYHANLEYAVLDQVTSDETTQFFALQCPAQGAFLGYKKCCDDRLVHLLIPAAARRTSATARSCRCDMAKVLYIENFDGTMRYDEAWSLVDPKFVYRPGQWVRALNFNEDRWMDSTGGIHFWLTLEEAKAY